MDVLKVVQEAPAAIEEEYSSPDSLASFYAGVITAITSSLFIGISFILKKQSHMRLSTSGGLRAGEGGCAYLKDVKWWLGLILLGLGECLNFIAYSFAPAAVVTPLGALSVIITAILASRFLKERLNLLGKIGCFLCLVGSTIIVIHAPKGDESDSLEELLVMLRSPVVVNYIAFVTLVSVMIAFYFGPKYGTDSVIVYILLCAALGSLSVIGCKGVAQAVKEFNCGENQKLALMWGCTFLLFTAIFIVIQMKYLNRALDLFSTNIVTPVYYVLFTSFVIMATGVLFKEWMNVSGADILGELCGFLVIITGIFLLHAFKDVEISVDDLKAILKPKREELIHVDDKCSYGSGGMQSLTRTI